MSPLTASDPLFSNWRWPLVVMAALGGALCILNVFATQGTDSFFTGYLFAWLFFLGLSLGGMCIVMIHNLTGGPWGEGARVIGRAASLNLPLLAVLFIPVVAGLHALYPWARAADVAADATLQHRAIYLNVPAFVGRAAFYLFVWILLANLLARWQRTWQHSGSAQAVHRIRALSAIGLILYALTMTHAGVDWIMSRDTSFNSTAFGLILTVGQTLAAFAWATVLLCLPGVRKALWPRLEKADGAFIDMGNILLVLVILWTYVSFMQFLVIWMGNEQDDNSWYVLRGLSQPGAWRWIGLGLIAFHFFIPFFVLLFRGAKRNGRALAAVAWMLLAAHVVEMYWLVAPSSSPTPALNLSWVDAAAFLAVGACWLLGFFWLLARRLDVDRVPVITQQREGASA